ncbi:MAG: efflux RND transporter periplasmic adaptor subunit [Bacteroidota bacterium]
MNSRIGSAMILSVFLLLGTGCRGSGEGSPPMEKEGNETRPVDVRIREMRPVSFSESIRLAGTVKAREDVLLSPEEGGIVREWSFEKGQSVPAGAVVVELNDEVLRAGYEAAEAQARSAELTYRKQQTVFEEKAVSEWQLRTAEYARDAARAQADLMKARLQRARLQAPVAGVLDDRYADTGEMAPPGVPLARIVNISSVKVLVNVPERYAGTVSRGAEVEFDVPAYPGRLFHGRIGFIGQALSPDNRTFPVEIYRENPQGLLRPEMVARVRIVRSAARKAILVEQELIQQVDRGKEVVFVEEGGRARQRILRLGGSENGRAEVLEGLREGDRLIIAGHQNLADGQPVRVRP